MNNHKNMMAEIELARNCDEATAFSLDIVEVKEKSSKRVLSFDDEQNDFCVSSASKLMKLEFDESDDERESLVPLSPPDKGFSPSSSPSQQSLDDSFEISAPVLQVDDIQDVLERADDSPRPLVADFSRPCSLPTVQGRHGDLTAISPDTLASLLAEQQRDHPEVKVIDCRYPYEFAGGHIRGAKNLYTETMIKEEFLAGRSPLQGVVSADQRQIVVFHCEFSIERGPGLLRFLREQDRALNGTAYPALHHPEVYILEGGYSAFYEHCRGARQAGQLCEGGYRPMLDEAFCEQLKFFRRETKTSKKHAPSRGLPRNKMAARSKSRLFV